MSVKDLENALLRGVANGSASDWLPCSVGDLRNRMRDFDQEAANAKIEEIAEAAISLAQDGLLLLGKREPNGKRLPFDFQRQLDPGYVDNFFARDSFEIRLTHAGRARNEEKKDHMTNREALEAFKREERLDQRTIRRLLRAGLIKAEDVTNSNTPPGERELLPTSLTLEGYRILDEEVDSVSSPDGVDLFVSHSSEDQQLAALVVDLLRSALTIRAGAVLCTSVDGYRLPAGSDVDERLRDEILAAKAFIGILSPYSLASAYVLFELGARWGAKKHLAPLMAHGMTTQLIRGPVAGLNALRCDSAAQLHQLVLDIGLVLGVQPAPPQANQAKIDAIAYFNRSVVASVETVTTAPRSPDSPTQNANQQSPSTGNEFGDVDAVIRQFCESEWPDDYAMRAYCTQQQHEAADKLKLGKPTDIPQDIFIKIRGKCATEYPFDYSMRLYCESQQFEGYRQIHKK